MRNAPPSFNGYEFPSANFENARTQFSTPFDYLDIALDTAIVNQIINISGDFLYVDTAFDGIATLELNNEHSAPKAPFKIQAGWAINATFKQIKFNSSAQIGKKIRLMFSTGERVIPAFSASLNILGTVATLEDAMSYGASYKSITNLAVNTPEVVFSPASNINGAIIHAASISSSGAANTSGCFLAKNSAPATVIDGDSILTGLTSTGDNATFSGVSNNLVKPIKIAAGKGLYAIASIAEIKCARSVLYTLL